LPKLNQLGGYEFDNCECARLQSLFSKRPHQTRELEFGRIEADEKRLRDLLLSRNLRRLKIIDLICLNSVDSTQSFISRAFRIPREGDLVMSRIQTAGKGRENRTWVSQEGGLWLTVTLTPPTPESVAEISTIATVAVAKTLEEFGVSDCVMKPPNDVYHNGKKIAGVLADASINGSSSVVFLGAGINVNNDPTIVDEISQISTSVKLVTGRETDLIQLATVFIQNVDLLYDKAIIRSLAHE
jgi:BirA family biotin operon repressor/biotin-[acetyl-CoA-carboxylase] ligase